MSFGPGETTMRCEMPLWILLLLSVPGPASMTFARDAYAEVVCSGHKLLPIPRPQSSCSNVKPRIYPSPDGALRALVFPVDVSLYYARHGEPRGDPHQQGRYSHVEGLFLAARYQRVLCLQCKMVARLAILRLQYVVVRRPFALVVSDDGV